MNLRVVAVRANYLRNENESNDKERKNENERGKKINNIYMPDKQRYSKF